MEIQTSETERRIVGNVQVLEEVESEIAELERQFAGLESLEAERERFSVSVQNLRTEEAQILQETTNESAIVKKLTACRGARDVQTTRLRNTEEKIEVLTVGLTDQVAAVRKVFAGVMAQLWEARRQRTTTALSEMFGGPFVRLRIGRIELRELLDQTQSMKNLKDSRNRFVQTISDPAQEKLALQRTRSWLTEIKELSRANLI
jgi:hypothetical protein